MWLLKVKQPICNLLLSYPARLLEPGGGAKSEDFLHSHAWIATTKVKIHTVGDEEVEIPKANADTLVAKALEKYTYPER